MNSPLKSPITNNKCTSTLKKIVPEGSVVHSFLYFDGNIEVSLSNSKRFVVGHTNKYVNYEFWKCLLSDPERLSIIADHFCPIESRNIFDILQKEWVKYPDPFVRSALFFLLNQSSDAGFISSGKLRDDINLYSELKKLKNFSSSNLHIQLDEDENFIDSINSLSGRCDFVFVPVGSFSLNFLDDGKSIGFEQNLINHSSVRDFINKTDKRVILLYKYSNLVAEFFSEQNQYIVDQWGRHTESSKFAKEVLIANF